MENEEKNVKLFKNANIYKLFEVTFLPFLFGSQVTEITDEHTSLNNLPNKSNTSGNIFHTLITTGLLVLP